MVRAYLEHAGTVPNTTMYGQMMEMGWTTDFGEDTKVHSLEPRTSIAFPGEHNLRPKMPIYFARVPFGTSFIEPSYP